MTNLEMFYFTGKCLTIAEHPGFREEIIEKIVADSIDWQKFIGLCSNHLILPVIYLKLKSQDIIDYLPEEVSDFLKEIYALNCTRNNQILKQLEEVTGILNKGNIYPVYLKGAGHLLDGLYTDTGERMIGDIDLLVPEKDYLSAAKLLEKEGYSADCPAYLDVESLKHYPRLFKTGVPADIEIHRLPVSKDFQNWFNPEMIFKEKKIVSILEGCFTPSYKHNIIHNFIHSQLAHEGYLYGRTAFRDLYDLYLLSKRAEVKLTVSDIRTKQKAMAYFAFAGKALGLPGKFHPANNLNSWLFTKKHEFNYGSRVFFYTYRTIIYIIRRIFIGFTSQIIQSLYSKKMRQSVFRRLSDRQYLRANLDSYKNFFSPNK